MSIHVIVTDYILVSDNISVYCGLNIGLPPYCAYFQSLSCPDLNEFYALGLLKFVRIHKGCNQRLKVV